MLPKPALRPHSTRGYAFGRPGLRGSSSLLLCAAVNNSLDEQTIKQDYFDTVEGIDLLVKAAEQSTRTRSEEKRDLIARTLCGATIDSKETKYSPEEYLHLISDLTVLELTVARSLYENPPSATPSEWNKWEEKVHDTIGIDEPDLHITLNKLNTTGLLQHVFSGENEAGLWIEQPKYGESGFYRITQMFDKLMNFLQLEK